jgi:hypothetical protein
LYFELHGIDEYILSEFGQYSQGILQIYINLFLKFTLCGSVVAIHNSITTYKVLSEDQLE